MFVFWQLVVTANAVMFSSIKDNIHSAVIIIMTVPLRLATVHSVHTINA